MAYKKTKKTSEKDPVLEEIMGKFNAARDYARKGFWPMWKDCRSLKNSKRVAVNYAGDSDTFVPETFTIIQSVKSNVIGGKIKIEFMPTSEEQFGDTRVLNSLMDQIWTIDKTKLKASWAIEDSLDVGNGYLWQYVGKDNLPCNLYIPTEDNFFDPSATNYENLRYGGYRYLTTRKDLEAEMLTNPDYNPEDEKSDMRIKRYKNLDQLDNYERSWKQSNDKTAKQLREEMLAGSVLASGEDKKDIVEVIVYIDKKRQIKIANRCVVIEDIETPFKREAYTIDSMDDAGNPIPVEVPEIKPFIPVAPARDYVDGAMWYAKGEIEVIGDLQELLNDTQNQKTDNLSYANNMAALLDPSQAHKKDEIQLSPGVLLTLPPGSLEIIRPTPIGTDTDNEMYRIQSMMRRATAADEIVQGAATKGDATATEINAQLNMAGTRFGSKLENYESEFFAILANNMFKILQIFLTREQAVRMIGPEGVEWKSYNPGEFMGDYDVKVALEGTARAMKEEEKQSAMQFYLMAAKMPFINQENLFKVTASHLFDKSDQEIEKLIQPVAPMIDPNLPMEQQQQMTQQGQGTIASAPQSGAENAFNAQVQQSQGLNVPGMPTA